MPAAVLAAQNPPESLPETVSDFIFLKCNQIDLVDMLCGKRIHAGTHKFLSDSVLAVRLLHTYMIQAASSSVMSAENRAHNLPLRHRHHAGGRIPSYKTLHALSGIIDAADSKSVNLHP